MKQLRKFLPLFTISLIISMFCFSNHSSAATVKIIDDGSLYSDSEEQKLNTQLQSISDKHNVDMMIYTTDNLDGQDPSSFALSVASELSSDDKVVLFISIDPSNHKLVLHGYGKAKTYIGTESRKGITSEYSSYFTNAQYYEGTTKIFDKVNSYLGKNPKLDVIYYQLWFQILVSLGIALVVVLIMALHAGGKMTAFQSTYLDKNNSKVIGGYDRYMRTEVTRTKRESSDSSDSGGSSSGPSEDSSSF